MLPVVFDEAAERVKFEAWAVSTGFEEHHFALRDDGNFQTMEVRRLFAPWLACAKSRAEVK